MYVYVMIFFFLSCRLSVWILQKFRAKWRDAISFLGTAILIGLTHVTRSLFYDLIVRSDVQVEEKENKCSRE